VVYLVGRRGSMYFITTNPGKFNEVKRIANEHNIEINWLKLKYPELQGDDLVEIAKESARILSTKIRDKFFIEDSGLFIEALKGFPGPYSSYVFKTIGNKGILKLMEGQTNRSAYFKAVVAYFDGDKIHTFTGKVNGTISRELRGFGGFGFDPIFEYKGRTFAEMGEEKNKVSHRRIAFKKFFEWLTRK